MHISNSLKKKLLMVLALIILIIAGVVIYNKVNNNSDAAEGNNPAPLVALEPSGITFPEGWQEAGKITQTSKQSGVISQATREDPAAVAVIRQSAVSLGADFNIKNLPDEVVTSLKAELEGFKLGAKGLVKIGSREAARITYTALDGEQTEASTTMYIVPTQETTYYITYQTSDDIDKLKDDISAINKSIASYLDSKLK